MVKGRKIQNASTATIKRDLTAISGVIDHAIDEGWTDENPTLTLRHRRMKEKRDPIRLPDEEEIALVKAAAPERFADAMDFARETGMREDEIFGLKWKQIGSDDITIYGKRNRLRVIPLSRELARSRSDRRGISARHSCSTTATGSAGKAPPQGSGTFAGAWHEKRHTVSADSGSTTSAISTPSNTSRRAGDRSTTSSSFWATPASRRPRFTWPS
jgi:integrase